MAKPQAATTRSRGVTWTRRGHAGRASKLSSVLLAAAMVVGPTTAASAAQNTKDGAAVEGVVLDGAVPLVGIAEAIGATELWAEGITGTGVDVAIIDTGLAPVPALAKADVIIGPDLSFEAGNTELTGLDTYGHGTHMAGTIAAKPAGIDPTDAGPDDPVGIAPGARLISVKVGDSTGAVDVSQVIAAIDWVVANRRSKGLNIRVLNLSYNTSSDLGYVDDPLSRAVENAWRAGIVVVVSAGNDGRGVKELANPANNPYVIAAAAAEPTTSSLSSWRVPNWGTQGDGTRNPDVTAPGSSVASLRVPGSRVDIEHPDGRIPGHDDLFRGSGTSQAAAVVSGAAALLLDTNPKLTPDQVKALLTTTSVEIDGDESREGHGLINVHAAAHTKAPADVEQSWDPAVGAGSLEQARGDDHVTIDGNTLEGEITFNGSTWDPETWIEASPTGSSWTGSSWTGSSWTGSSWTGSSWTGSSWTGSSWTGSSWTGSSWTGSSWTGSSWTGSSWTTAAGPAHPGPAAPGPAHPGPTAAGSSQHCSGTVLPPRSRPPSARHRPGPCRCDRRSGARQRSTDRCGRRR